MSWPASKPSTNSCSRTTETGERRHGLEPAPPDQRQPQLTLAGTDAGQPGATAKAPGIAGQRPHRLDRVLQELYPSAESESRALGDLRQFLTRLREAARESGKALRIDSGNKKAPISERDLWFQFSRLCNERIEDFSRAGADLDTETLIEQKTQVVKARVRYLIDCVDSDQDQAKRLITDLRQEFAIAKEFSFEGWCPLDLQPGPRYPIRLG